MCSACEGELSKCLPSRIADQKIHRTCFFVLGLVSSTVRGAELLEACGWTAGYTPIGLPTGYCLPEVVDSFVEVSRGHLYKGDAP